MRQYLTATIQAATPDDLKSMIDPMRLAQIKAVDPHPDIRVYSIGHEGKANLHLPGIGTKTFTWIQAAVQWIKDKLEIGTKVFDRHDPSTNAHEGRTQIGEVVGKAVKHIGDRLNTLAAIHIFPNFKSRQLDVASIEADIEYDHDDHQAWPVSINNVSGIALSNSGIDTPGFQGATFVGAVQAYVQAFASDLGDNKMNLSDVKSAVRELKLTPTQVFDIGDVMGDSAVVVKVKEENKNVYNMSERIRGERDTAQARVVTLEGEKATAEKTLARQTIQSKGVTVLDTILNDPNLKLGDKTKAFVKRDFKRFDSKAESDETLKVELGTFVENSVKEFKEVFGEDTSKSTVPGKSAEFKIPPEYLTTSTPAADPNQKPAAPIDMAEFQAKEDILEEEMDPDKNPLIVGGKASVEAQTP